MLATKCPKISLYGVRVKRCASFLWLLPVLCAAPRTGADQSPPDKFAGQVTTDSKIEPVGIGTVTLQATVDVYKGEIKIGSTGATCIAEFAGALRSDSAHLQVHDGAGWRNVSLDKAL
jgi:hypothetical protein